jgi:hypothetical protein
VTQIYFDCYDFYLGASFISQALLIWIFRDLGKADKAENENLRGTESSINTIEVEEFD